MRALMPYQPLFPDEMDYPSQEVFEALPYTPGFQPDNKTQFDDSIEAQTSTGVTQQLARTIWDSGKHLVG